MSICSYEDVLRDGVVLCHLINKISPGSVKKIQERGTNFQLMENIQRCDEFGIIPPCGFAKNKCVSLLQVPGCPQEVRGARGGDFPGAY